MLTVVILALYFLPTLIAAGRKTTNGGSVLLINLLLGWTIVGWWMALGLASSGAATRHTIVAPAEDVPLRLTAEEWATLAAVGPR
jgi:hypothetical protein